MSLLFQFTGIQIIQPLLNSHHGIQCTSPLGPCWLVNVYGEPIYTEGKTDEQVAEEVRSSLLDLEKLHQKNLKRQKKLKLWKKQKKITVSMLQMSSIIGDVEANINKVKNY